MLFLVGRSRLHTVKTSLRRSFATETMLRTLLFTGRPLCNCYGKVMLGKKSNWLGNKEQIIIVWWYPKQLTTSALNWVEGMYGQRWTISALNWAIMLISPTIATSRSKGTKLTIIVMEILSGRFYSWCIRLHVYLVFAVEASNSLGLLIVGQVYLKLNPYLVAPSCVAWEGGGSSRIYS